MTLRKAPDWGPPDPRAVVAETVVTCKSDICAVWEAITDTERMNRAVGLEKVAFSPLSDQTAARYLARTRLGGFEVTYEERPFEWVYLRRFRVLRRMRNGPAESLDVAWSLEETEEGGSRVYVRLATVPRYRILSPVIRYRQGQSLSGMARAIRGVDESGPSAHKRQDIPPALHQEGFARARDRLFATDASKVAKRVAELVELGADVDVSRIRPFALADEWALPRRETLSTFLRGVQAGMLDLRWEVICPSCRTATDTVPTLSSLTSHGACQLCELSFELDLDEAVEATFAPAAGVRQVDDGPYCIGGPARTPHVLAQVILPASSHAKLTVPEIPGRYRLFFRGGATQGVEVAVGAPEEVDVPHGPLEAEEVLRVAPEGSLVLHNADTEERHAKIEQVVWTKSAASAREVTATAEFRRVFSSDVLRPGTALKISRVTLLFSDLTASTRLYLDAGDAAAFKVVQDHFDLVIGVVERQHGSLVKTMGDAVMAVFADEVSAVRAGMEILTAFRGFRESSSFAGRTDIKLGVYAGSCYAVTANQALDYFGQTVNVAARLQAEARSGELVIDDELYARAEAAGALDQGTVVERYEALLKGLDAPTRLVRVRATEAGAKG